jgi:hypothetical protein
VWDVTVGVTDSPAGIARAVVPEIFESLDEDVILFAKLVEAFHAAEAHPRLESGQ